MTSIQFSPSAPLLPPKMSAKKNPDVDIWLNHLTTSKSVFDGHVYEQPADALTNWLQKILALATPTGFVRMPLTKRQELLNQLDQKIGFSNALALLATAYQLAQRQQPLTSSDGTTPGAVFFKTILKDLVARHGSAYQQLNLDGIIFDRTTISPLFVQELQAAAQAEKRQKILSVMALGLVAMGGLYGFAQTSSQLAETHSAHQPIEPANALAPATQFSYSPYVSASNHTGSHSEQPAASPFSSPQDLTSFDPVTPPVVMEPCSLPPEVQLKSTNELLEVVSNFSSVTPAADSPQIVHPTVPENTPPQPPLSHATNTPPRRSWHLWLAGGTSAVAGIAALAWGIFTRHYQIADNLELKNVFMEFPDTNNTSPDKEKKLETQSDQRSRSSSDTRVVSRNNSAKRRLEENQEPKGPSEKKIRHISTSNEKNIASVVKVTGKHYPGDLIGRKDTEKTRSEEVSSFKNSHYPGDLVERSLAKKTSPKPSVDPWEKATESPAPSYPRIEYSSPAALSSSESSSSSTSPYPSSNKEKKLEPQSSQGSRSSSDTRVVSRNNSAIRRLETDRLDEVLATVSSGLTRTAPKAPAEKEVDLDALLAEVEKELKEYPKSTNSQVDSSHATKKTVTWTVPLSDFETAENAPTPAPMPQDTPSDLNATGSLEQIGEQITEKTEKQEQIVKMSIEISEEDEQRVQEFQKVMATFRKIFNSKEYSQALALEQLAQLNELIDCCIQNAFVPHSVQDQCAMLEVFREFMEKVKSQQDKKEALQTVTNVLAGRRKVITDSFSASLSASFSASGVSSSMSSVSNSGFPLQQIRVYNAQRPKTLQDLEITFNALNDKILHQTVDRRDLLKELPRYYDCLMQQRDENFTSGLKYFNQLAQAALEVDFVDLKVEPILANSLAQLATDAQESIKKLGKFIAALKAAEKGEATNQVCRLFFEFDYRFKKFFSEVLAALAGIRQAYYKGTTNPKKDESIGANYAMIEQFLKEALSQREELLQLIKLKRTVPKLARKQKPTALDTKGSKDALKLELAEAISKMNSKKSDFNSEVKVNGSGSKEENGQERPATLPSGFATLNAGLPQTGTVQISTGDEEWN